jgi:hypothetical protein
MGVNWEELKEESENLIKKDGFVAIEKDEWEWIVDTIESLALENIRLDDGTKGNGINHKVREMFEREPILNVKDLMEIAYQLKLYNDLKKIQNEERDPIKDLEKWKRICLEGEKE